MSGGWIKLNRTLLDHPLWKGERFTKGQAWVDLLMLANHKPNFFVVRGNTVNVDRGQLGMSQRNLAARWGWHTKTTKSYISMLEKESMITLQATSLTSIITICNYDSFQKNESDSASQNVSQSASQSMTQSVTQTTYKQEVKNKRKKEGGFIAPTSADVFQYMKTKGCSRYDTASHFTDHFTSTGWCLSGGRKVKDWKSAANNWLRREKKFNGNNVVEIDPRSEEKNVKRLKQLEGLINDNF